MDAKRENQNVVSLISHGDGQLVVNLLQAIQSFCDHSTLRVIVTVNIPEDECHIDRQRKSQLILPDFMLIKELKSGCRDGP